MLVVTSLIFRFLKNSFFVWVCQPFGLNLHLEFKPKRQYWPQYMPVSNFHHSWFWITRLEIHRTDWPPLSLSGCSSWEPQKGQKSTKSPNPSSNRKLKFWVVLSFPSSGLWPASCGGKCQDLWEDEASLRDQLPHQIPLQGWLHPAPHPDHPVPGQRKMGHAQNYLHESWVLWQQTSSTSETTGWFKIKM